MTGLNHGWDGDERPNHADFVHGAVDAEDFTKEVDYAPRRKKKGCKKSKNGEPCSFTKLVVNNQWWSPRMEKWVVNRVMTCERCGKHEWRTYGYEYRNSPVV